MITENTPTVLRHAPNPIIVGPTLAHGNTRYVILVYVIHSDANVFRLQHRLGEPEISHGSCHPRTVRIPVNKDVKIAAMKRQMRESSGDITPEVGIAQPRVVEVILDN